MSEININFLKKLIELQIKTEDMEKFIDDYKSIHYIDTEVLLNIKKVSFFDKNKGEIINFIKKYNDLINKFNSNDILYEMTSGMYYKNHFYEKEILSNAYKVDKNKVINLLNKLEENIFDKLEFSNETLSGKYFEKIRKTYGKDTYDIEYYSTDGQKEYLAYYYNYCFPVIIKDAKILLIYKNLSPDFNKKTFDNQNKVIINNFDIDIENLKFFKSNDDILEVFPSDEINKFSRMCSYIINIDKNIYNIKNSLNILENLFLYKELKIIHEKDLVDLKEQINKLTEKREKIIEKYCILGYNKDIIEKSIKYLTEMEWYSSIDVD